jgi:flavin reductase (DIM6/NTAB) family NADH-FMN oxidoreductase RutF
MMSHSPAMIAIGITKSDNKTRTHGRKDTLENIEETGHLVVNSMNQWYAGYFHVLCVSEL